MEQPLEIADIVIHKTNGKVNPNRNIISESKVIENNREIVLMYEKYHSPELMKDIDFDRVFNFIENESGKKVSCNIFILDQKDKENLKAEKMFLKDRYDDFSDFYDNLTNSVVVFRDSGIHGDEIHLESRIVHELSHASGIRVLSIDTSGSDNTVFYENKRLGLRVDRHGTLLEESYASSRQQRYFEKFVGDSYFQFLSSEIGKKVEKFDDIKNFSFIFPNPPVEGVKTIKVPLKYANLENNKLLAGQSALTVYVFDMLQELIYLKSSQNLDDIMNNLRSDLSGVKSLANEIDNVLGPGGYSRMCRVEYGDDTDLGSIIPAVLEIQEKYKSETNKKN